ncbi:MAG: MFS transporter [Legionella sp.]
MLEWYEFSLCAVLTPMLARNFFPTQNSWAGLMMTYAVFAIGFLARPLGAAYFGHLGDRQGRKKALLRSIVLMALCTLAGRVNQSPGQPPI